MIAPNGRPTKLIEPERLAEAAVWISRLHSSYRNDTNAAVKQWLKADSMNAAALELATEVWEDSANLRRIIPAAGDDREVYSRRLVTYVAAAVAAAVMIAAIAVGVFRPRGEVISTVVGEQRWVTFPDNTRVFLNTATRVVVRYDQHLRRVELKSGEALFDVAKRPEWPFIVQAGAQQVTALGTSFAVRRDREQTVVTLVAGRVTVVSDTEFRIPMRPVRAAGGTVADATNGGVITLRPGQRLTFTGDRPPRTDTPPLDHVMAWVHGQIVFDDTPLSSAVAEMNRYSSTKLVIEGPVVARLLVNGLFQASASASFARAIADAYNLSVTSGSDEIFLSGEPKTPATSSLTATH
jgi:transmembrane sensor